MGLTRFDGQHFRQFNTGPSNDHRSTAIAFLGKTGSKLLLATTAGNSVYRLDAEGPILMKGYDASLQRWLRSVAYNRIYDLYSDCERLVESGSRPLWILPEAKLMNRSAQNSIAFVRNRYLYFNSMMELVAADTGLVEFEKVHITGPLAAEMNKGKSAEFATGLILQENTLYVRWKETIYRLDFRENNLVTGTPVLNVGEISNITCFLEVPDSDIYLVGTLSDGLYIFQRQQFSAVLLDQPESEVVYALAPLGGNGFLTWKGGIQPGKVFDLPSVYTSQSILHTKDGNYLLNRWVNKLDAGIVVLDSNLRQRTYIREDNLRVKAFLESNDGSRWLAAAGHYLGKLENNRIKWLEPPEGLPANFPVQTIIEDSARNFWLGGELGLARVCRETNQAEVLEELKGIEIRQLYEDSRGTLWVSTYGKGLYAICNSRLIRLPTDYNNHLAFAHAVVDDGKGYFWIPTNNGLFQVLVSDLYDYFRDPAFIPYFHEYERTDGFLTNEFNGGCTPAGVRLKNGFIALPSMKGIVQFNPEKISAHCSENPIYVEAVIGGNVVRPYNLHALQVKPGTRRIQFIVSSPFFGNPRNNLVEYNIEGVDSNWYPLQDDGMIHLNKLPAGNYTLNLCKRVRFGRDNLIMKQVAFVVLPAFHETLQFWLLMSVLTALIFYGLAYMRFHYLVKQKAALEDEIRKRTGEQDKLINELSKNVQFRQKLAMILTHDLQSPMRFLADTTERVMRTDVPSAMDKDELVREVSITSRACYHLIEEFSTWLRTLDKDWRPQQSEIMLDELAYELSGFISSQLKDKGNTLRMDHDAVTSLKTDRQLLKIILRNILDNANKVMRNGTIDLHVTNFNGITRIRVMDTGPGIRQEILDQLNRTIDAGPAPGNVTYSVRGNGFRFIIDFCKLLNIRLTIENNSWGGATINLYL
ncbi:hypothetical protein OI18_05415 [Flavihumibacter solisilvae]|uniref:Histidine kinase domain-containing protein n=2 Tax=Flavihumibacter solisilvae TaxID=1349421 RepID=A0A0C1IYW6_9BACT|nr:hypothetical protein OI18_05415 [Flavihumibacter solisilvae]